MKKVLVTGVAGLIGSKVAQFLLEENYKVIGIDNLNDYYDVELKRFRLKELETNKFCAHFTFVKGDIEDKDLLKSIFEEYTFDCVYNIAARAGVRYSMENPDVYFSTNVQGTLNLLECMKNFKVKKFVLSSTSSLYAGQPMPFIETLPVNNPISPYAASKKAAEVLAYTYHHLYEIDVSILRYFTVYGPLGRPDMGVFRFIRWIDKGESIQLFGDGEQARDFTYVDDIAKGTILAGEKNLGFEVINLGGGKTPISINSIINSLEKLLNKDAIIKNLPFHKADVKVTWANIDKANKVLGWTPQISIEEGLKRTVEHYKQHNDFYRRLKCV